MTPNTTVTLYATPFDVSNKYVIAADSPGEALAIVSSYPSKVYTDCYWQRDNDFVFRANGNINEVEQYNYCVYLNNGRYNFAFITECDYVNDAMTLVHLATDPWLNFAGQYVFHDSPMVRCHPASDNNTEGLHTPEPMNVLLTTFTQVSGGLYNEDSTMTYLVTTLKSTSLPDTTAITDYWNGMLALAQQTSVSGLINWSLQLQSGYTYAGNAIQPNTSVGTSAIDRIVDAFIQNGMQSAIIAAYHVPTSLIPGGTAIDAQTLPLEVIHKQLNIDMPIAPKWRKTKVSPQFRKIVLNCAGNSREIPLEFMAAKLYSGGTLDIDIITNPNMFGNFTAQVQGISDTFKQMFQCVSPVWDRVPLVGYGVDQMVFKQAIYNTVTNVASTGFDTIGQLTDKINWIKQGVVGTLAAAGREVAEGVAAEYQNAMNTQQRVLNGGIAIGGASASISAYNQTAPLFKAISFTPSGPDVMKIDRTFGTYGYIMDGEIVPIEFKTLPYWKYYQTQEAAIEGRKVPQRYLSQIIQRFNAGIFVFNDVASYKDFSKALDNHY